MRVPWRLIAGAATAVTIPAYVGYKYRGRHSSHLAYHEAQPANTTIPTHPLEIAMHTLARRFVISFTTGLSRLLIPFRSRVDLVGLEKLHALVGSPRPNDAPLITVANHHSVLDDPGMMSLLNIPSTHETLRWSVCTEEICFEDAFPATWFALGKAIPITRGASIYQKGLAALQDRVNEGQWAHVFSEARTWQEGGTPQRDSSGRWCSPGGRCGPPHTSLGPLKWGVGKLIANASREPIVLPLFHMGMADVAPQNSSNDVVGWDLLTSHLISDGERLAASLPLFKKFWTFCYVHHLEGGQKSLPLDTVKLLAPMLIKERGGRFPWAEEWGSYLEALPAGKTVSRDTWSLLPELAQRWRPTCPTTRHLATRGLPRWTTL